jgi:hypothetical protein
MNLLGLVALALAAGILTVQDAQAKVRVKATLRTPNVRVDFGNGSSCRFHNCTIRHMPIPVNHRYFKIGRRDRTIAVRLARYTGVPSRDLLRLRRHGFRWFEIGRFLHLPRPVVRAAMNHRTWKRFLREQRWIARHGNDRRRVRGVAHSYDVYDDYDDYDD